MSEQRCPACGSANRPGAKFCAECGTPLALSCPTCGAVSSGGRFCDQCGAALGTTRATASPTGAETTAGAVPSQPEKPVAERRLVSLLFADLVGFTPLAESRDPEAVRELLSGYFDRARTVVARYGGNVEKFVGDAVMAVWGVPAVHEDDAERAVRAGLDLVSTVTALGEELGIEGLAMRVGITTGHVAVTLGVSVEGSVAGDAVNAAARVQAVATPGEVWVDDATRALTQGSVAYLPVGEHRLKGKSVPMPLFRAVRTTAVVGGEQRVDGLEAPFVGRDRELQVVKELFHAIAEEHRARLVLVAGDPGIGKSRLAWEFEKYVDAITTQSTWWLRGRCASYGTGVAGHVLADMVRSLLRVTDADDLDSVARALEERLEQHVADPAERGVLRPRLQSLLGLGSGSFEPADLFACWRGFLEALTRDGSSVTLLAEDLQWADDGFFEFLDHLLEAARGPIMVLALARPELPEDRPALGAGRRATTVFLEPLGDDAMGRLLDGLVADLPPALRAELVRRAEGVPLYGVETVRALIDRDVVVPQEGRYVVDPQAASALDLETLGPPNTLHALLAARLDALDPDERRVVQDASVLGLSFTRAGIETLAPPGLDLDAALESLRRREILTVDSDPRSPERGQYRFVQALLRAVAYDTLSRRDRQARHLAVAAHLEQQPDAEGIAEIIAAHYLDACAAGSPDAPRWQARAAALLESAAARALQLGGPRDAFRHYRQLLGLPLEDADVVRVVLAGWDVALQAGDVAEAAAWLDRGLAAVRSLGDEEARLALTSARGQLAQQSGDAEAAVPLLQEVVDASADRPDRVWLLAPAAHSLVLSSQATGDVELARRAALRALPMIEGYGDDEQFETLLGLVSVWFSVSGYRRLAGLLRLAIVKEPTSPRDVRNLINAASGILPDDPVHGAKLAERALRFARDAGLTAMAAVAEVQAVAAHWVSAGWPAAVQLLRDRAAEGPSNLRDWETYRVALSALFAVGRGDPGLLLPAVAGSKESADPAVSAWALMRQAGELALQGAPGASAAAGDAVVRLRGAAINNEDLPLGYDLAVELLLREGDIARLDELTGQLEQVPVAMRFRLLQGQLLRARALLTARSDGPAAARAGLSDALAVFDAMGATYRAARTRVDLAELLAAIGPSDAAGELLAAAEPLLIEIEAAPALAQLQRVRRTLAGSLLEA